MNRFLLDTNIASYLISGRFPALRDHVSRVPMSHLCVSAVTEGELRFGVTRRPDSPRLALLVDEFLLRVPVLPWDSSAARYYGQLRASLERQGKLLGNLDLMIAAHAGSAGAVLVTHDRAFSRISGLKTVDWTR